MIQRMICDNLMKKFNTEKGDFDEPLPPPKEITKKEATAILETSWNDLKNKKEVIESSWYESIKQRFDTIDANQEFDFQNDDQFIESLIQNLLQQNPKINDLITKYIQSEKILSQKYDSIIKSSKKSTLKEYLTIRLQTLLELQKLKINESQINQIGKNDQRLTILMNQKVPLIQFHLFDTLIDLIKNQDEFYSSLTQKDKFLKENGIKTANRIKDLSAIRNNIQQICNQLSNICAIIQRSSPIKINSDIENQNQYSSPNLSQQTHETASIQQIRNQQQQSPIQYYRQTDHQLQQHQQPTQHHQYPMQQFLQPIQWVQQPTQHHQYPMQQFLQPIQWVQQLHQVNHQSQHPRQQNQQSQQSQRSQHQNQQSQHQSQQSQQNQQSQDQSQQNQRYQHQSQQNQQNQQNQRSQDQSKQNQQNQQNQQPNIPNHQAEDLNELPFKDKVALGIAPDPDEETSEDEDEDFHHEHDFVDEIGLSSYKNDDLTSILYTELKEPYQYEHQGTNSTNHQSQKPHQQNHQSQQSQQQNQQSQQSQQQSQQQNQQSQQSQQQSQQSQQQSQQSQQQSQQSQHQSQQSQQSQQQSQQPHQQSQNSHPPQQK